MRTDVDDMYHGSPIRNLKPEFSVERSLCLADDENIASSYLRGGDCRHYVYSASWDRSAAIATEADLHDICEGLGITIHDGLEYEAAKNEKVRKAIVAAGYVGVRYGDTHEGCNYECVEFFAEPEGFRWALWETVEV